MIDGDVQSINQSIDQSDLQVAMRTKPKKKKEEKSAIKNELNPNEVGRQNENTKMKNKTKTI